MHSTTITDLLPPEDHLQEIDAFSLYHAFEQVQDHRQKRGVRYSIALVLTLVVLGKLAGMTTLAGITHWVRLRSHWLVQVLPTTHSCFPCAATYSNVLQTVEAAEVTAVIAQFLTRLEATGRCGQEPSRLLGQTQARGHHEQVILDGKTLRGTLGHSAVNEPSVHLVALYEAQTGVVLAQQAVPDKGNEISLESVLLTPTAVQGRIVTADAMHTQRACCATITRFGGHFVLFAKANQPLLAEDLRLFFEDPPSDCRDWRQARTCSKGHGRLEIRELVACTELNEFLAAAWPGIEQVFCLTRTVHQQGQVRVQTVYGISSLTPQQASAARLLELVRRHWTIENRLHWRRDVTLGEDQCQVRKRNAPQVLAALNNVVLSVLDFLDVRNVARQMRWFNAHPERLVRLLLGSLLTVREARLVHQA